MPSSSPNQKPITYRPLRNGEETEAIEVVLKAFDLLIAGDYSAQGIAQFRKVANPQALEQRVKDGHDVLVAEQGGRLVGVMEVRQGPHIVFLFVDPETHRQGIARELVRRSLQKIRHEHPDHEHVTVNATLFALPIYERLGFVATDGEKNVDGIRFVPMKISLAEWEAAQG